MDNASGTPWNRTQDRSNLWGYSTTSVATVIIVCLMDLLNISELEISMIVGSNFVYLQ